MGSVVHRFARIATASVLVAALLPLGAASIAAGTQGGASTNGGSGPVPAAPGSPMTLAFSPVAPTFTIGLPLNGTVNVTVDWGDGSSDPYVTGGVKTHSYANAGPWTVSVTGAVTHFGTASANANAAALTAVTAWGDVGITDLSYAFFGATALTSVPATLPAGVTSLVAAFSGATSFNGAIGGWDTSQVTSMWTAFNGAASFNGAIGSWDTSKVLYMTGMFNGAASFNGAIGSWDTSSVVSMSSMFSGATAFNGAIDSWDTSKVTTMTHMFKDAASFNGAIGAWDTTKVTTMGWMFYGATAFNQDISSGNTSAVADMSYLLYSASAFNQPIGSWDTSAVSTMEAMFAFARAFNQNLAAWDTAEVASMSWMFRGATDFNQDLTAWDTSKVTSMAAMLYQAGLTTATYSAILTGWAAKPQLSGVPFSAGSTTYSASAVDARDTLTGTYGWVITDGGLASLATPLYVVPSPVSVAYGTDPASVVYGATYYTDAEHTTELAPVITGSAPTCTAAIYAATTAVGAYAGAVACTGGTDDAYTFDTTATADLNVTTVLVIPLPDTATSH